MATGTERLSELFAKTAAEGRAALIGYLPVGYPDVASSIEAMVAMVKAGADIVEVGIPYSDPVMDGPVIQQAASTALAQGVRVDDVFAAVRAVHEAGGIPVVMAYWNLVLHRGVQIFARELAEAGGAGLITPDLIPDEGAEWIAASDAQGLARIFLVAPSSTPERLSLVTAACEGFVYAASTMGVTGARTSMSNSAQELVSRVRQVSDQPVCVGVGVSNPEQAAQVAAYADGVIVGTALVTHLGAEDRAAGIAGLAGLTKELAEGVRARK